MVLRSVLGDDLFEDPAEAPGGEVHVALAGGALAEDPHPLRRVAVLEHPLNRRRSFGMPCMAHAV